MLRLISRTVSAVRTKGQQLGRDERGSIVSFLVVIPVLAGAVAIGVETGQVYRVKRHMQAAADAAAMAGSIDRSAGKSEGVITTTAQYESQRNGFTHGVNSVAVAVNAPPTSGPNVSTAGAVEVIITKTQSFSLGAVLTSWLGGTSSGFTMRARSVAAQGTFTQTGESYNGCIVALTPLAEQGVSMASFNNFHSDCTVISNGTATASNSSASVYMASFNNATFKTVWTRGSFYAAGYNSISLTDPAQTNQTSSVIDPFATQLAADPFFGGCTQTAYKPSGGSSITIPAGVYCEGLEISSFSNVYFTPGTYYIVDGDLYLTSINNVSCPTCTDGAGVTFVLTRSTSNANIGGVRITSENNVTLSAPNSGTYKGVLFYQDRRANVGTMTSTSKIFTVSSLNNAKLQGAIYFPNNRIDLSSLNNAGNSTDGCTVWVGRYIKFSSYNNNFVAGCEALGTKPVGVVTTTTVTKAKVYE
jgi:Flp pilus assembly protein TadG